MSRERDDPDYSPSNKRKKATTPSYENLISTPPSYENLISTIDKIFTNDYYKRL